MSLGGTIGGTKFDESPILPGPLEDNLRLPERVGDSDDGEFGDLNSGVGTKVWGRSLYRHRFHQVPQYTMDGPKLVSSFVSGFQVSVNCVRGESHSVRKLRSQKVPILL